MSILGPDAKHFVIVGDDIRDELEHQDIFTQYFEDKRDQLEFLQVDKFHINNYQQLSTTLFIIKHFEGECFDILTANKCSIMGSIALLQTIRQLNNSTDPIKMVPSERPLHNLAMQKTLITFSGITSKIEAQQLLKLTRYMGAKSREDVTNKTTHLVAGNVRGMKYAKARIMGLSIMSTSWVYESFRIAQFDMNFEATMNEISQQHKLKPFGGLNLAFVGFTDEDRKELCDLTTANEGTIVEPASISCTHIVLDAISGFDDSNTKILANVQQNSNALVVFSEWFWASLEMEAKASEDDHAVPGFKTQTRRLSKARRTSSTGYNSFSNMLSPTCNLDYSRSPEGMTNHYDKQAKTQSVSNLSKSNQPEITERHKKCLELLHTEKNYVKVLETIIHLFKHPLENPTDTIDPVLPMTDVKIIFGNLTPIYEVHKKILASLEDVIEVDWKETNSVGTIYITSYDELFKAYYPFVNFFEDTKKTINVCDEKYPRFHAFLKRCQSNKDCNRESLTDMLIRPVQRLPMTTLIIEGIMKKTEDSNPDKKTLSEALKSLKKVTTLINEDKRKIEGQIAMFDIVNNIQDCPPELLSATRHLVCKVEARLLSVNNESEITPSKSHKVVLFLFSDLIEICKIRSLGRSNSLKGSRNFTALGLGLHSAQSMKQTKQKELRHLDELRLHDIVNIYKKCESPEMSDAIVIEARPSPKFDQNYRYYPFIIDDVKVTKSTFLERLEESLCVLDDPEQTSVYLPKDLPPISNDEIDFGYANLLVNTIRKSGLCRGLSLRQVSQALTMSPSIKTRRNIARINSRLF